MIAEPPRREAPAEVGDRQSVEPSQHEPAVASGRFASLAVRCRPRRATILALVVGLLLGAAALSLVQMLGAVPPPPPGGNFIAEADSDLILTVREPYLSRMAAQGAAAVQSPVPFENVRVDVLPGRLLRVLGDIRFMGQRFQAAALMSVGVAERRVQVAVREVHLGSLAIPVDLDGAVAQPINQELARLLEDGQFEVIDVATADDRLIIRLASKAADARQ